MSCVLSITGSEFNVDDFIAEAGWLNIFGDKLRVHRTGEVINSLKRRKYRDNGFSIIVSDAGFDDLKGQQRDVLAFIKQHGEQLSLLKKYKTDGWNCFDFGLDVTPPNNFSKTYTFQPELLLLIGQLGIEMYISNYFTQQEKIARKYKRRRWPVKK